MQLHLSLATFEYQNKMPVRTVTIDGEPWFYASDVCNALAIKNPSDALTRLDKDDLGTTEGIDSMNRTQNYRIVNESGLYDLVFQSRTEESKKFKRWVTKEVLPQIRKTGGYGRIASGVPVFVRRFNDNWDRVEAGHFSVISELFIRVYGRLEQLGHHLADKGPDGREIRPDVSVGKTFSTHLKDVHTEHARSFKMYSHLLPDGTEVEARQYPYAIWPIFTAFVDTVWLPQYAPAYLESRDVRALEFLPKLLPPPDPRRQETDIGMSKMEQMKQEVLKVAERQKNERKNKP